MFFVLQKIQLKLCVCVFGNQVEEQRVVNAQQSEHGSASI